MVNRGPFSACLFKRSRLAPANQQKGTVIVRWMRFADGLVGRQDFVFELLWAFIIGQKFAQTFLVENPLIRSLILDQAIRIKKQRILRSQSHRSHHQLVRRGKA